MDFLQWHTLSQVWITRACHALHRPLIAQAMITVALRAPTEHDAIRELPRQCKVDE